VSLVDEVRRHCAGVAAAARQVRIDLDALDAVRPGPQPALDPERHYLEGSEADVATYLLTAGAVNFGSGWFPTLRKRRAAGRPASGSITIAWALTDRFRAHGPWTNAELRAMRADELADVLGQPPDHELMSLYAQALRSLGTFLGERSVLGLVREAGGSAVALAESLAAGMALFDDRGFYKKAQIAAADLALAGVARFQDLDRLTIFADNLVPHVLRCDGVLVYDPRLAAHIDAGRPLRMGPQEREIRACAVHAAEQIARRLGVSEPTLDHWLWNRGQEPAYKARPRHRCRTVYY
jgi:Potential Queuosine, Q, salvage protein family